MPVMMPLARYQPLKDAVSMTVAQWNHIHLVRLKIQATLSERCSAILKTPIQNLTII